MPETSTARSVVDTDHTSTTTTTASTTGTTTTTTATTTTTNDLISPTLRTLSSKSATTKHSTPPPLNSPPSMPSSPITDDQHDSTLLPPPALPPTTSTTTTNNNQNHNDSSLSLSNLNINSFSDSNNGSSNNNSIPDSPVQPPTNVRRPSFGLNLLNSLTSSIRTTNSQQSSIQGNAQPPQPSTSPIPTELHNVFMSNSPTIANLNTYASTTLHDEAMANVSSQHNSSSLPHRHRASRQNTLDASNPIPENDSHTSASSNSSDQEQSQSQSQSSVPNQPSSAYSHDDTLNNVTFINQNNNLNNTPTTTTTATHESNKGISTNITDKINEEDEIDVQEPNVEPIPNSSSQAVNNNNVNNNSTSISTDSVLEDEKSNGLDKDGFYSVRLTPLIDHSSSASGLYFSPIIRKIKPKSEISIGRYTEKNKSAAHAPQGSSAPIVFKSKVVSRTHALFQCNEDGQWFLRDCKSSSGTFLNHIRLSPASQESTLMPLIDGDIIQLGMDYRGGTEEVYRCVKMRCEFNKSWQRKVNQFNLEIHKKIKNLQFNNDDSNDNILNTTTAASTIPSGIPNGGNVNDLAECAICLMKIEPCQALFISPCSHAWHYKCIRPIIIKSYPQFYCPNCRTMCDLETDLDEDD